MSEVESPKGSLAPFFVGIFCFVFCIQRFTDIEPLAAGMIAHIVTDHTTKEAGLYRCFIHAFMLTCDRNNFYSDGSRGGGRPLEDSGRYVVFHLSFPCFHIARSYF